MNKQEIIDHFYKELSDKFCWRKYSDSLESEIEDFIYYYFTYKLEQSFPIVYNIHYDEYNHLMIVDVDPEEE
jgi:hypothetical protein